MKKDEFGNSEGSVEAAEYALSPGESRQMHGGIFGNRRAFHELALARYAKKLGVDERQLRRGAMALLRALEG